MYRIIPASPLISILLVSSIVLAGRLALADEPLTSLPPRTMPLGTSTLPGIITPTPLALQGHPLPIGTASASRLVGITKPAQFADLSVSVSSPIVEVLVRTGDRVKAGDVLVRLDDRIPQAALKVAETEARRTGALSSAMVKLQLAEQQLQRATIALQRQAGSQFEVEEKTATRDQARAQVTIEQESLAQAQAALERARAELSEYSIRAPFDGEVVQVHQKAGSLADRSNPAITIADRRVLNVELHLPLAEFGSVDPGSRFMLLADVPVNRELEARVTSVSPYVNAASRTFRVELEIDNHDEQLPAGFTVRQPGASGPEPELLSRRR